MDINVIESSGSNEWDHELSKTNAGVFLTYAWLDALNSNESQPVYLKFLSVNKVVGFIAGLIRPIRNSTQKQLFFYSGPACADKDPVLFDECRKALLDYAKTNGFQRLTMHSYDVSFYVKTSVNKFTTRDRSEYFLDLTPDFEEFEGLIDRDTRRRIRKAKKNGVVFGSGYSDELLDILLFLMKSTFDVRLSKDYDNYNMFSMQFLDRQVMKRLLDSRIATLYYAKFADETCMSTAHSKGNENANSGKFHQTNNLTKSFSDEIVSIQFVVAVNQRAYGIYMGTNALGYKMAAPSLLFYEIAHSCKQMGFHHYNIGGVPLGEKNEGIRGFKKSLGAKTIQSCEETTDFLLPPLKRLNIFLSTKRALMNFHIPWQIKKQLLKVLNIFLKDRDQY